MKRIIFWGLLSFPILWAIEKMTQTPLLAPYQAFLMKWWQLGIVIVISYFLLRNLTDYRNNEMEKMRERRYLAELSRYRDTPYVSPIMVMYMTNPPQAFSKSTYDQVHNTFYRTVVNHFRDRVFIHAEYNRMKPRDRQIYIKTVGIMAWSRMIFYIVGSFTWFAYWFLQGPGVFLEGWQLFTLPLVVLGLARGTMIMQAITEHLPDRLDKELSQTHENIPQFTWRDAFPDNYLGQSIIRAYEAEKESRMRYQSLLTKQPVPLSTAEYHNPNYAPFPYPSMYIPDWADEMAAHYQEKKAAWKEGTYKGNVIPLHKKAKKG